MMSRGYYAYIMCSKSGVLCIGSTNDLERRVFEHKHGLVKGFTRKYRVSRLVYVEEFDARRRWSRENGSSRDGPEAGSWP